MRSWPHFIEQDAARVKARPTVDFQSARSQRCAPSKMEPTKIMKRFYAPQTRTQEHQIVIDAPSEFVWTALTEAQELPRWLVDREAWVEPRVGGKIWRSWGGGSHEEGRIDVWEPRHRLGLRLEAFTSCGHRYKIRSGITEEFQLVKHGAQTELYLVHAGVPVDSEWDHYYSTTNRAWMMYLRTLRHYLEYHRGKPRRLTKLLARLPGALEEAWLNLAGTCGLSRRLQGENQFTVRTLGTTFSGNVSFVEAPIVFDLIIRELD